MATYKKPLFVTTATTLMGFEAHFENGEAGRYAYEALQARKTISGKYEDGEGNVLVPFHAVKIYQKSVNTEDAERADAYCE